MRASAATACSTIRPKASNLRDQNALARFDRDVLAQPGVTHLIVFEGINDIGMPALSGDPAQFVSADELIAGLRQLAERAHEHGIVVFGATITPFEGSMLFSEEGEAIRAGRQRLDPHRRRV